MADTETPAFDALSEHTRGQAGTMADAMGGEMGDEPDPDPEGEVLDAIGEGRTIGPQRDGEHVVTLASLGYSIETVADALDMSVEEVEATAAVECERIAGQLERIHDHE